MTRESLPTDLLSDLEAASSGIERPEHFTNHRHCCECEEHDQTLRGHDPASIGLDQLGHPGWDPICFITHEGFRYYLPALARLALGGDYLSQFLFHLTPERVSGLTADQCRALLPFLRHLERQQERGPEWSDDRHRLRSCIELLESL